MARRLRSSQPDGTDEAKTLYHGVEQFLHSSAMAENSQHGHRYPIVLIHMASRDCRPDAEELIRDVVKLRRVAKVEEALVKVSRAIALDPRCAEPAGSTSSNCWT